MKNKERIQDYFVTKDSGEIFSKLAKDPDNRELLVLYVAKVREESRQSNHYKVAGKQSCYAKKVIR